MNPIRDSYWAWPSRHELNTKHRQKFLGIKNTRWHGNKNWRT